ncbi:hypothetical protein ACH5RR_000497 [Cinchona calisaya]|uniref:Uncharacterized protein n=1 Tax=Cinchona calisaya TaxID=153742 RepID=A0ABD3B135_9GENT
MQGQRAMIKRIKIALVLLAGLSLTDVFPSLKFLSIVTGLKHKLLEAHQKMDEILDDIVKQHKANHEHGRKCNAESGDEDLVDVLLRQQESGKLQIPITTRNIKAIILPRVMAKVQAEVTQVYKGKKAIEEADIQNLKYFKIVIKETLGLHPSAPLITRTSRESRELDGYMILDKTQVLVNIWQ